MSGLKISDLPIAKWAENYMRLTNEPTLHILLEAQQRRWLDKCRQGLLNNMWSNNPGELDRWADDGGCQ